MDREWYEATGTDKEFPNLESASEHAEKYTAGTGNPVTIDLCTRTAVRRYKREVTVVAEDVTPQSNDA